VEASPALFHQETVAARKMLERVEKLGIKPTSLGADTANGSGEFLDWVLARGVEPHIPVIDHRHQTDGHFTRDQFVYDPVKNAYECPEGKILAYRGLHRSERVYVYQACKADCRGCPQKEQCTSAPSCALSVNWYESAREIEALFAELKLRLGVGKVRLRRLWNVSEQFLLAATAQNIKRLVHFLAPRSTLSPMGAC